jgi:hypothetical protein
MGFRNMGIWKPNATIAPLFFRQNRLNTFESADIFAHNDATLCSEKNYSPKKNNMLIGVADCPKRSANYASK